MEGKRHHLVFFLALALLASSSAAAFGAPSYASAKPGEAPTIRVGTGPDGIDIGAERRERTPGSGGAGPSHTQPIDVTPVDEPDASCQISPEYDGWMLIICGGVERGAVPPSDAPATKKPAAPRSAREVAESVADHIPLPQILIHANPSKGMVGVESWFWFTGYDGKAIQRSGSYLATVVNVRAVVRRYVWYFGDGATQTSTTPGTPYPRRSEVHHTYQRSSIGRTLGYPLRVEFEFDVTYRVGTGRWRDLPPIVRTARSYYPVRESQAVIQQ